MPKGAAAARGPAACPSAPAVEGALLIGVVGPDGRTAMLGRGLPVDADFLASARRGRAPEARFRFSTPCLEAACAQWTGAGCGVIARVAALTADDPKPIDVAPPPCPIRARCRWFAERGAASCAVCPDVITDTRAL